MRRRAAVDTGLPRHRRVALVAGSARTLIGARAGLIRALVARGVEVICLAPDFSTEQSARLLVLGVEHATFDLEPKGPAFMADWQLGRVLADQFRQWKPDTVIGMSERVMALAMIAARRARVDRRIALFNGFVPRGGQAYDAERDPLRASPRLIARALKAADAAVFHNRDDLKEVAQSIGIDDRVDCRVVAGAGVDLEAFAAVPLPPVADGAVFVMISALDEARGVLEFCEAARRLKARAPRAEFLLAGPVGDGASAVGADLLRPYADVVTFLGALADVRPTLARAHVFVYPSHGEGMPRAVLEALAVGRPIIAASTPGCRETVDDCVNGMLVPPGNVVALEDAMARMLMRPDQLASMARASRRKAERHFGEGAVIEAWLDLLGVAATAETGRDAAAA